MGPDQANGARPARPGPHIGEGGGLNFTSVDLIYSISV